MAYVDLATIFVPASDASPPPAWGAQIRDNFEALRTGSVLGHALLTAGSVQSNSENANVSKVFATSFGVTFTGPPSGLALVEVTSLMGQSSGAETYWSLHDGTNLFVTGTTQWMAAAGSLSLRLTYRQRVSVTPGASVTVKPGFFRGASGSAATFVYWGGNYGDATMTVTAL